MNHPHQDVKREWLVKATDEELSIMHDNVEGELDQLSIGLLNDGAGEEAMQQLDKRISILEVELEAIQGEMALRRLVA